MGVRVLVTGVVASMALFMFGGSAGAQQEGLVNVNITDVEVQVPVAVAANICDVDVNVLASGITGGPTTCDAGSIALADGGDGGRGRPTRQEGLINVNVQNVDVEVPIAIAANVCGVAVNVLVSDLRDGPVACTANGIAVVTN